MIKARKYVVRIAGVLLMLSFQFCTKQTENFSVQSYKDYYPLSVGKHIIYRMDSTVFEDFDRKKVVRSYQAKDIVDAEITDNLDRKSFRIRRMIRSLDGSDEWKDLATFMVTPLNQSLEYIENNQRYIKLKDPVKESFYWNGNSYINIAGELSYLQFWEYNYQHVGQAYSLDNTSFGNTITVLHVDESAGDVDQFPDSYASRDYSVEVYSKDLGLVFKDFEVWTYQATPITNNCRAVSPVESIPCPVNFNCDSLANVINGQVRCDTLEMVNAYSGYGIRLSLLDHN
ncbi:MAG: hypothetical protein KIT80_00255 [Chitinophagaceae bacterium]|nr:hypothetical protein [Chitinophagaceae bacterium]MCW5925322.1 hypothetical protein [Chitinophagaceae bacterium]